MNVADAEGISSPLLIESSPAHCVERSSPSVQHVLSKGTRGALPLTTVHIYVCIHRVGKPRARKGIYIPLPTYPQTPLTAVSGLLYPSPPLCCHAARGPGPWSASASLSPQSHASVASRWRAFHSPMRRAGYRPPGSLRSLSLPVSLYLSIYRLCESRKWNVVVVDGTCDIRQGSEAAYNLREDRHVAPSVDNVGVSN